MTTDKQPDESKGASDDMKRRFREALDRKKQQSKAGQSHLNQDSAVHGAHGAASKHREFRRKSG